jgi:3-hydroxybutyryl-CoA dehydratase
MKVGQKASLTREVTARDVETFARLTGDENPVHLDDDYAAKTRFGRRIAHGVFAAGLISAVLGTKLPGFGAVYLHQSLDFKLPVFLGDTITAEVVVTKVRPDKPIVTLETRCVNQDGAVVLSGQAVLLAEDPRGADNPGGS